MLRRAIAAGNLSIRDVADENVQEGILRLVRNGSSPRTLHESLALERVQGALDIVTPAAVHETAQPEHLAHDGRVLKQLLLAARKTIESRGDDSLDRLRDLVLPRTSLVGHHLRELLGIERVAAGAREQSALLLGFEHRRPEQVREEPGGV